MSDKANNPNWIPPEGPPLPVKVRVIRQLLELSQRIYVNGLHDWRKHRAECPVCGTISAKPPCPEGQRLLDIAAGRETKIETEKEKDSSPAAAAVVPKTKPRASKRKQPPNMANG